MSEFRLEELKKSKETIGEILPVIKDQYGNILDGFHRKRADANWKETVVNVESPLQSLQIRVHANVMRRDIGWKEKHEWILEAQKLLLAQLGREPSQQEIADALKVDRNFVKRNLYENVGQSDQHWKSDFYGYNVWGFKDEGWRKLVLAGDPNQPDKEFYRGSTPAFVVSQLIEMFQPKTVLDSMAGVGTTGYVCALHNPPIECDQYDLYPYPKHGVLEGDAESIKSEIKYDLIFNHIPYLDMVKYGDHIEDLSNKNEKEFFDKLKRVFLNNYYLLANDGTYAILVGDWRFGGRLIPITAKTTQLAHECGFILHDEAIKLTAEQKGVALQEYRASKFGYLAQTFDMVLIFRRA